MPMQNKKQNSYIQGRLGYNSQNDRYGLLSGDLWENNGFHCGECFEVLIDNTWVDTRIEMSFDRKWSTHHIMENWNMLLQEFTERVVSNNASL